MLVEVTATNSFGVSRPVSTPLVHSTESRSSRPPVPFGILVKFSDAEALLLGGEGAMVGRHHLQRAGGKAGPQRILMALVAERRAHHAARRIVPVLLKYSVSSSVRCWISGSP